MENFWLAIGLTTFAGLSTGLGSILAFFTKKTDTRFLASALSFSAGVMIYISFVELFDEAREDLQAALGSDIGVAITVLAFFMGILLILLIDRLVPEAENPHHVWDEEQIQALSEEDREKMEESLAGDDRQELHRVGLISASAIAIHNFPEGLVTFVATMADPALGISIAIAIALHNIPEGIAVSIPIFYATGSRVKAVGYAFLAGLAEPIGAVIGYLLLYQLLDELIFGLIFAFVAGIMVFISIDELLPTSQKYGEGHRETYAFIAGMLIMAVTLLVV